MNGRTRGPNGIPGHSVERSEFSGPGASGESAPNPSEDGGLFFYLVLFGLISVALLAAFAVDKHLSADGVHYFVEVLDGESFYRNDWTRRFAEYATQWPLVLAVRAGLTDVPALSAIYAVGIYLPFLLSFALSVYAVRGENPALLSLPLLSMASVNLPAHSVLSGEHHVMVLLASPILLLILRRERPTSWDGAFLALALVIFSRTYPTAVAPALLFAFLLAIRLHRDRDDPQARVFRILALVLSVAAAAFAMYSILNPRSPTNQLNFRRSIPMIFEHPETLLPAVFSVLFLLGLVSRRRIWPILAATCLALYVPYVTLAQHGMTAHESFAARTLSITLLPSLLLLAVAVRSRAPSLVGWRRVLLAAMLLVAVVWNVRQSSDWARYRGEMIRVLRTERGFVPMAATALDEDPRRWGWTNPELSVVWSYPVVRAIVENAPNQFWEPYDPRRVLILKRYVRYDAVFAGVDPTAEFEPESVLEEAY